MARPLSEEKKQALLEAAAEVVAAQGLAAPTAQIAKRAGVAEGTLFRYFETKEVLLSELLVHLSRDLGQALENGYDPGATLKARTWILWSNYIGWGITNPFGHRALIQLMVSGLADSEACSRALSRCGEVRGVVSDACDFAGLDGAQSTAFAETVLSAIAQATITAAAREPEQAEAYKHVGFGIMWRGLAGA
jgi:AcrR family transcriptional regulator